MTTPSSFPGSSAIFDSPLARPFVREWERLCRSTSARRAISAWGLLPSGVPAASLPAALLDACGFLCTSTPETEATMFRLMLLAADDPLAARIVLQRLLPGLVAIARRRAPYVGTAQRAFDEVVAAAWIVIRRYPTERRAVHIAGNLLRDAEYLAFVQPRRLRYASEEVGLPDDPGAARAGLDGRSWQAPAVPISELVGVLAEARRHGVAADDLVLATASVNGVDNESLARRLGCCERTIRNRRRDAIARIRLATAEAA